MIFVRYTNKESCFACMDKYSSELNIRIAEEKCPSKGTSKNTRRDDDTIIKKNKSNGKLKIIFFLILSYLYYCCVTIQIYTNKTPHVYQKQRVT